MTNESRTAANTDPAQVEDLLGRTIIDIGIPPCPTILKQISLEMAREEPNLKYLDGLISSDVGLAAGLIALANSPFFGFRSRVRSVREALQMLGLGVASHAIAGLILRKLFPPSPILERFWDSSARIARLCGWLAQGGRVGIKSSADEAYTFGLFRDCGIPVLLKRFPQHYPEILKQANLDREEGFTTIEDRLCQANHAAVGCLLAQAWWLPDDLCLAIRHHHDHQLLRPEGKVLPRASLRLIAIADLAEHLFQKHTGLSPTQEWSKAWHLCLELLAVDEEALATLYEESQAIVSGD